MFTPQLTQADVMAQRIALLNRWARRWRHSADRRRAGRKRWCRDKFAIALPRRRTIGICGGVARRTLTGKCITVGVRRRVTVSERFQEGNDLVLLRVRQAEHSRRCVQIVRHFFHRPAGHPLNRPWWAVSGSDRVGKLGVARIVEVHQLLEALDVAVVEEFLLEVRYRLPVRVGQAGLGGGTLRRGHCHIAHRGHLELAVNHWCQLYPVLVWVGGGAETASQESSHAQISVAETVRIPGEPKAIRRGLIVESIPWIERETLIGRAEAGE